MFKNEFIDAMKERASVRGTVVVQEIKKPDMTYTGLYVKKESGVPTPVLNVDALYYDYTIGRLTLDMCFEALEEALDTMPDEPIDVSYIKEWEKAKTRLIIRIYDNNPGGLYDEFEGKFFCPYVEIANGGVRVTEELLDLWEVSLEEVFDRAALNSAMQMGIDLGALFED